MGGDLSIKEEKHEGYEQVVHFDDERIGLHATVAIHNTNLGPACGGIRLLPYPSKSEAVYDVLRLSRGMSYKSSLAGIGFGGGKSVIIASPQSKTSELLQRFGECVESLGGRYICAKDMNITSADLLEIRKTTNHVLGIDGVLGSGGDPSPITALGVFYAMEATLKVLKGSTSFQGISVAIQGLGHVGIDLAKRIHKAGGKIIAADVHPDRLAEARKLFPFEEVSTEEILDSTCDIFSPCARGAILNPRTIGRLKCKAIVGCANNQLESPQDGFRLHEKGILYTPDYLANAGGIINVFTEHEGYSLEKALERTQKIYFSTLEILEKSKAKKVPPFIVADEIAEEKIHQKK